jgi:hypothetical protein
MMKEPIFLSASIPDREPWVNYSDPVAIREAILALVAVAVPERELVFGGHPAISPLVEHAARTLGKTNNVHIFQSRWFEQMIPPEAQRFKNFHWTDKGNDKPESLLIMRHKMIEFLPYCGAVFIGGMDGIEQECDLFKTLRQGSLVLPIASTQGASLDLWKKGEGPTDPVVRKKLEQDRRYRSLFRGLLP